MGRRNLHLGARSQLFTLARHLRQNETQAEKVLWQEIRNKKLNGSKFRRQHPIGKFIVDFYCHKEKLIIEVDGSIHDDKVIKNFDEWREGALVNMGFNVLRFRNSEILEQIEEVKKKILCELEGKGK